MCVDTFCLFASAAQQKACILYVADVIVSLDLIQFLKKLQKARIEFKKNAHKLHADFFPKIVYFLSLFTLRIL